MVARVVAARREREKMALRLRRGVASTAGWRRGYLDVAVVRGGDVGGEG